MGQNASVGSSATYWRTRKALRMLLLRMERRHHLGLTLGTSLTALSQATMWTSLCDAEALTVAQWRHLDHLQMPVPVARLLRTDPHPLPQAEPRVPTKAILDPPLPVTLRMGLTPNQKRRYERWSLKVRRRKDRRQDPKDEYVPSSCAALV